MLYGIVGGGPRVVVGAAAFHARVRGSVPGLGGLKETKMFLPHARVKVSVVGSLRDREVACSASDRQGSNFESCVWRTVSSHSSHHPQEVLLAQFSLYVHKCGLKPDSFHFILYGIVIYVASITSKLDHAALLSDVAYNFDILVLTETFLNNNCGFDLNLNGYLLIFRKDRSLRPGVVCPLCVYLLYDVVNL